MIRIERRLRSAINPYSTRFAKWWCESGRQMRLSRVIAGGRIAARPAPARRAAQPPAAQAARREVGSPR